MEIILVDGCGYRLIKYQLWNMHIVLFDIFIRGYNIRSVEFAIHLPIFVRVASSTMKQLLRMWIKDWY